jgi:hypothetical protein
VTSVTAHSLFVGVVEHKYKYRLILDESQSFGMIGDHGKGITEYYGIPVCPLSHTIFFLWSFHLLSSRYRLTVISVHD